LGDGSVVLRTSGTERFSDNVSRKPNRNNECVALNRQFFRVALVGPEEMSKIELLKQ